MTPEEAVRTRILALPAVSALVGTRVYLDKVPQTPTYPLVRVVEIDDPLSYHLRGPDGHGRARVQVDLMAREGNAADPYSTLVALVEAVQGDGRGTAATGLSGWMGTVGGSPGFEVRGCLADNRRRGYAADDHVLLQHLEYLVTYRYDPLAVAG